MTEHHFGYVKVIRPLAEQDSASPVVANTTQTVGLRLGNGVGIGFFNQSQLYVPLDCRVVLIVANQAQLDDALKRIGDLKEGGVCASLKP